MQLFRNKAQPLSEFQQLVAQQAKADATIEYIGPLRFD